ncbi:hypothetical protein PoB_004801900 [Plakobranchus ocellatus]|uniref:Uncharacterized protein n=1 Tax=Plakobranchus ocellatus TaxID=259542 RepID=A0AAV4BN12_9GAST|nr:hypothetical protein PoB_004801900 [Plakobranchus ocellatus]
MFSYEHAFLLFLGSWFLYIASSKQGDIRLLCPPPGQGAGGWARIRDRRLTADLRADSLATVPPTPPSCSADMGDVRAVPLNAFSRGSTVVLPTGLWIGSGFLALERVQDKVSLRMGRIVVAPETVNSTLRF